jgi:hypothetical protein
MGMQRQTHITQALLSAQCLLRLLSGYPAEGMAGMQAG